LQGFARIAANSLQIDGGVGFFRGLARQRRPTIRFWSVLASIPYRSLTIAAGHAHNRRAEFFTDDEKADRRAATTALRIGAGLPRGFRYF